MRVIAKAAVAAVAATSVCLLPSAGRAADEADKIAMAVDGAFKPLLDKYDVPGMAVAVTVEGRQYFFNYGVASKEKKTPVTKDTLFELDSVSKTFAATLFGLAQTRGNIALDDHPSKFMPELRNSAIDRATLLNLGTYTAGGLPLQFPGGVGNDRTMVRYFEEWKPSARPGAERHYSNPSIVLFGHLAARALKGNYADLVEHEILPKLGLRHTYIRVPAAAAADYASGYKADKAIRMTPDDFGAEAYGIRSSAADMIRYVEANIRPETLDEPIRRAIESTHVGYFQIGDMVQGLGWEQYGYPVTLERLQAGNAVTLVFKGSPATQLTPPRAPAGPILFNKTGSTNGFGAYVAYVPEKKIGVVMLANRNFSTPARIAAAHKVLEALAAASRKD